MLACGVRARADPVAKRALRRHGGHVDTATGNVVLPAVIRAAQPALLVAAEEKVGAPMRAARIEKPYPPVGVAEGHQVLAHNPDADGWPSAKIGRAHV